MSGISLDEFLDSTVPDILRKVQPVYPFVIVGTRSVNSYLVDAGKAEIATRDWDVLYIGDEHGQEQFASDVERRVEAKGFKVNVEHHNPTQKNDSDIFAFRSRSWISLSVSLGGDANITFLDIYRLPKMISGMGVFLDKEGLLYSDLGFLLRELNRSEDEAVMALDSASRLTNEQVHQKLLISRELLSESSVDLRVIDSQSDELIETIGQVSDSEAREIASKQRHYLDKAKRTLMRVAKECEALFGVIMSGKVSKLLVEQICDVCRDLDYSYGKYQKLKRKCEDVRRLCE